MCALSTSLSTPQRLEHNSRFFHVEKQSLGVLNQVTSWFSSYPCFEAATASQGKVESVVRSCGHPPFPSLAVSEKAVGTLYSFRSTWIDHIQEGVRGTKDRQTQPFQQILEELRHFWDSLYWYIQTDHQDLQSLDSAFQRKISTLQHSAPTVLLAGLGADQKKATELTKACLFIEKWKESLTSLRGDLPSRTIRNARQEYMERFSRDCTPDVCKRSLSAYLVGCKKPSAVCTDLEEKYTHEKREVAALEEELQARVHAPQSLYSRCFEIIDRSMYVKMSRIFYETVENITSGKQFQNIPILNAKMDPFSLNLFSRLGGALLLFVDMCSMQALGLPYVLSSLAIREIVTEAEIAIWLSQKLGKKESFAAEQLSRIRTAAECCLLVFCNTVFSSNVSTLFVAGAYLCGLQISFVLSTIFSKCVGQHDLKNSPFYHFVCRVLGSWGGICLISTLWNRWMEFRELLPAKDVLMSDRLACKRWPAECRRIGYETLGLPMTASNQEVIQQYRELARKYHPDVPGGCSSKFNELNWAKRTVLLPH